MIKKTDYDALTREQLIARIEVLETNSSRSDRTEQGKQISESYLALLKTTHDFVFINEFKPTEIPGPFIDVNDHACDKLGYSRDELLEMTPLDLIISAEKEQSSNDFKASKPDKLDENKRVTLKTNSGDLLPVELSAHIYKSDDKTLIMTIARDISRQLRDENRLKRSHQIAQMGYWGVENGKGYWSDNYYRLMGYGPKEISSEVDSFLEHVHVDDRERIKNEIDDTLVSKTGRVSEFRYITKTGQVRWGRSMAEVILNENKKIVALEGVFQDITELKSTQDRFETFFNNATDAIYLADLNCNLVDVNHKACQALGYNRQELLSMKINDIDNQIKSIKDCTGFLKQLKITKKTKINSEHVRKDGSVFPVEINIGLIEFADETYVMGLARDITETVKAEQALKESETMFRGLFNHINSGVAVYRSVKNGKDFVFVDVNQAWQKMSKISKADSIDKYLTEIFPAVKDMGLFKVFQRVWRTGESEYIPYTLYHDNRNSQRIENYVYKLPSGQIVSIYEDISAEYFAKQDLIENEERYRFLANATMEAVFISNGGLCTYTNNAACDMFGYSYDELIGVFGTDVIAPESKELVKQNMMSGYEKPYEAIAMRKDGTTFPALFHGRMFEYKGEKVRLTTCRDLSEQKQYEKAIKEHQWRLEHAEIIANFGHWEMDFNTGKAIASKGARNIYGFKMDNSEASIKEVQSFVLPENRPMLDQEMYSLVHEEKPYNVEFKVKRQKDGQIRVIHSIAEYDKNRNVVFGVIHDITDQKLAERALVESESRFRALFDHAPVGIGISSPERHGLLSLTNRAMQNFLGYSADELTNLHYRNITFPDDYETDKELFQELVDNKRDSYHLEKRYLKKDGSIVWGSLNVAMIRDDSKVPFFILAVIEDITGRKSAEEAVLRSLQEKDILLKEIHHRVKNNLQIIISLLHMQSNKFKNDLVKKACEESRLRIYSMALVHEKLYHSDNFSRINLDEYLEFLTMNLINTMNVSENISYSVNMPEMSIGLDVAIPCGLIVNEIITNAIKHAFPDGRKGVVSIESKVQENGEIVLSVSDNGIGLSDEWDILKNKSLGLKLIDGLIQQIDGKLNILYNKGTTFLLQFDPKFDN